MNHNCLRILLARFLLVLLFAQSAFAGKTQEAKEQILEAYGEVRNGRIGPLDSADVMLLGGRMLRILTNASVRVSWLDRVFEVPNGADFSLEAPDCPDEPSVYLDGLPLDPSHAGELFGLLIAVARMMEKGLTPIVANEIDLPRQSHAEQIVDALYLLFHNEQATIKRGGLAGVVSKLLGSNARFRLNEAGGFYLYLMPDDGRWVRFVFDDLGEDIRPALAAVALPPMVPRPEPFRTPVFSNPSNSPVQQESSR